MNRRPPAPPHERLLSPPQASPSSSSSARLIESVAQKARKLGRRHRSPTRPRDLGGAKEKESSDEREKDGGCRRLDKRMVDISFANESIENMLDMFQWSSREAGREEKRGGLRKKKKPAKTQEKNILPKNNQLSDVGLNLCVKWESDQGYVHTRHVEDEDAAKEISETRAAEKGTSSRRGRGERYCRNEDSCTSFAETIVASNARSENASSVRGRHPAAAPAPNSALMRIIM